MMFALRRWLIRPVVLVLSLGSPLALILAGCGPSTPPAPAVQTGSSSGPESVVDTKKIKSTKKDPSKIDLQ